MNEKQLQALVKQGEGQTLEFKDGRIHPRSLSAGSLSVSLCSMIGLR